MQEINLQAAPSQILKVVLGGQNCQISIYQKPRGLFMDVNVNGEDLVVGIACLNAVPIVCRTYEGFIGNLLFTDTQGSADPEYSGLGDRFALIYLTADEYELV